MPYDNEYERLLTWFGKSPTWLQEAAKKLLTEHKPFSEKDITRFADTCIKEARKEKISFTPVTPEDLSARPTFEGFSITSIANITGINALKQTEPLQLPSTGLVAILGANGSGKSGYARILKRASGNTAVKLLANIYEKEAVGPSCDITISRSDKEKVIHCSFENAFADEDLQLMDVFDTAVANQYIGGQSSPSYLPSIFSVLIALVNACDPIKQHIKQLEQAYTQTKLEALPEIAFGSSAASLIESISSESDIESFRTEWTNEDDELLKKANSFINEESPEAKIKLLKIRKESLLRIAKGIDDLAEIFSEAKLAAFMNSLQEQDNLCKQKRESSLILSGNTVVDISGNTWRSLWNAALEYSAEISTPGLSLAQAISETSVCPFCLRPLGESGKETVLSLKRYAESKISQAFEAKRIETEKQLDIFNRTNPDTYIRKTDIDLANLREEDSIALNTLTRSFFELKKSILNATSEMTLAYVDSSGQRNLISFLLKEADESIERLQELENEKEIERQRSLVRELSGKRFLATHQQDIEKEIERLSELKTIEKAVKATASNRISKMVNELSETLIAGEYIAAFQDELEKVSGGKITASLVKQRPVKGRIPYAIRLTGLEGEQIKPDDILSEGEKRVVSLAAFFAEARRTPAGCPLIFDDPISSLDENFEQNVLQRLIAESQYRQVIVFTHRISIVSDLQGIAAEEGCEFAAKQILALTDGIHKGNPVNEYDPKKKPDKRINSILQDLAGLKKAEAANDVPLAHLLSENICKNLRITLEACVEHLLLNDVVLRYRRDIQTKNRLCELPKIKREDCDIIDNLMTKYSFSEHYAPYDEEPRCFDYETLKTDCDALKTWISEFKSRPAPES